MTGALRLTIKSFYSTSTWSAQVSVAGDPAPNVAIVPGPQGNLYLVASGLPSDLSAIRIHRFSWDSGAQPWFPEINCYINGIVMPPDPLSDAFFQIPAFAITNGMCQIPQSEITPFYPYQFEVQTIRSNGVSSGSVECGVDSFPSSVPELADVPFVDARTHLKDNLRFLLRAADDRDSFEFWYSFSWPTNHVCVDFYNSEGGPNITPDPLEPLADNQFYRNFAFDPINMTNSETIIPNFSIALPNTGISYDGNGVLSFNYGEMPNPGIEYFLNVDAFITNPIVPPSALPADTTPYLAPPTTAGAFRLYSEFPNGAASNVYGLSFSSIEGAWFQTNRLFTQTFYPGGGTLNGWPYDQADQPVLRLSKYYFCRPAVDPMPETTSFAPTDTTPLIIIPVGGQQTPEGGNGATQLAGYAQESVTNASPGVYGYIGQYFANAYQIDDNGDVTTNNAGLLSPYGQFFATGPGPAALVTMPDPDTGQQGTCTVYCVCMCVDKNHDGTMDTSFTGADTTSQGSSMEFWVNNGSDKPSAIGGYDAMAPPNPPNWTLGQITCPRDLENFARLWICGLPALPYDYQVILSWANVSSGNPSINIFPAQETNGGTEYLTDTNDAQKYVGNPLTEPCFGTVTNGQKFQFPDLYFTEDKNKHLIFEGATAGEGELMLTIEDSNGNTIAQTGVWLDLHNIQDFYEEAVITNNETGAISNWTSGIYSVTQAPANALGNDTNLIVFVHGFNVGYGDWLDDSSTVFKRLYWAGFDGKFMTVKWPCEPLTLWNDITENTSIFNNSEIDAYKASGALASYLTQLRSRFPGYQLNVLAHSQGNAVMGEAIERGAPFDNYILTQGAMPDSSYDVNAPTNSTLADAEPLYATPLTQPMGYEGIFTNMSGNIINFYNTNDPVLAYWEADQAAFKPNGYAVHLLQLIPPLVPVSPYYSYDGTNGWYNVPIGSGTYLVTDPQESLAMISRSLTLSIGQSPPESAHGVISSGIDLKAQFGFNNVFPRDHSAEWTWPIQTTLPYYQQVLISFQIEPIP